MWAVPIAVEFTVLPDPVDVGIVGTGSALGAVIGGLTAYFLGYSLEDVATEVGLVSIATGGFAALVWLLGLGGLDLVA